MRVNAKSHLRLSIYMYYCFRYPINGEVSIVAGDFVMETWFYFLIGAIVLFKIIVIGGIIYVRKNNIFAKKSALPNIYGKLL